VDFINKSIIKKIWSKYMGKHIIGKQEFDFPDDQDSKVREVISASENSARLNVMNRWRDKLAKDHDIEINENTELADVAAQVKTKYSGNSDKIKSYEDKVKDLETQIEKGGKGQEGNQELLDQIKTLKTEIAEMKKTHATELDTLRNESDERSLYGEVKAEAIKLGLHDSSIPDFEDSVRRRFKHEKNSQGQTIWIDRETDAVLNSIDGKGAATPGTIAELMKQKKSTDFATGKPGLGSDGSRSFDSGDNKATLPDKTPVGARLQKGLSEILPKNE
jgi:hypothetical protein